MLLAGDTLVVTKLDWLGRDALHLTEIVTALARQGVGFRSLAEQLDTTSPAGRLVFGVFASLAAFERDRIAERTREGLAAARARGRVGGRPPVMTVDKLTVAARVIGVSRATLCRHLGEPVTGLVSGGE